MALDLESYEGKLLVVLMAEKFRTGGIPLNAQARGLKSESENLKKRYGIEITVEDIFEVGKKAATLALEISIKDIEAALKK